MAKTDANNQVYYALSKEKKTVDVHVSKKAFVGPKKKIMHNKKIDEKCMARRKVSIASV